MKQKNRRGVFIFLALLLLVSSCSGVKQLPANQFLYGGAKVQLSSDTPAITPKSLPDELSALLTPQPNSKLLGSRPKLWFYQKMQHRPRGLIKIIGKRYNQLPVLFSPEIIAKNTTSLTNYLFNHGYFDARVTADTIHYAKQREIRVNYLVSPSYRYYYESISFQTDSGRLGQLVQNRIQQSLLKKGAFYDATMLQQERTRITRQLHQSGYFDYSPDAVLFKADTSQQHRHIKLTVTPLWHKDGKPFAPYLLHDIYIFPEYSAMYAEVNTADTVVFNRYRFIAPKKEIRPEALATKLLLTKGDLYSQRSYEYTLNHLLQLDLFKFVDIKFRKAEPDSLNLLNTYIYLTPDARREVQFETEANTVEGYLGSLLNLSFKNKNWLRGAESFSFNFGTGIETPFGQSFIHTFEINAQAKVQVPHLLVPFKVGKISRYYIPFTNISLGYSFARRLQQYNIGLANFNFGYDWRASRTKQHLFNPAFFNYVQLISADAAFLEQLDQNPVQKRSFSNQLIFGSNYAFIFSNPPSEGKFTNYFYFKTNIELTGNLLYLALQAANPNNAPHQIFQVPFAQYARIDADFRQYRYLTRNGSQTLITRLVSGIGIPYGNSTVLPYVKQFFTGGSNDLRAFRLRSLGPGVSTAFNTQSNAGNFDRTGDIKLAANIEYRFSLNQYLKGALFADAGNVWLFNGNDEERFNFTRFYRQLGLGTGAGLRVDLSFFVLRFDWAFPLHTPTQGWVVQSMQPFTRKWRRENAILNLAIGYPF